MKHPEPESQPAREVCPTCVDRASKAQQRASEDEAKADVSSAGPTPVEAVSRVWISPSTLQQLANPDCLSTTATVFRNGGYDGQQAIAFMREGAEREGPAKDRAALERQLLERVVRAGEGLRPIRNMTEDERFNLQCKLWSALDDLDILRKGLWEDLGGVIPRSEDTDAARGRRFIGEPGERQAVPVSADAQDESQLYDLGVFTPNLRRLADALGLREGKHSADSVARIAIERLALSRTEATTNQSKRPCWKDGVLRASQTCDFGTKGCSLTEHYDIQESDPRRNEAKPLPEIGSGTPVDIVRARRAAQRLTDVAFGNKDRETGEPISPHFEIPANPDDDDIILARALDELEALRALVSRREMAQHKISVDQCQVRDFVGCGCPLCGASLEAHRDRTRCPECEWINHNHEPGCSRLSDSSRDPKGEKP